MIVQVQFSIVYQVREKGTIALDALVRADCLLPDRTEKRSMPL